MDRIFKISELWEYREFDRELNPVPEMARLFTGEENYTVDQVGKFIDENGMHPIELSFDGDKALVTDGNHRLTAARKLGYTHIVARINNVTGKAHTIFHDHTLSKFKTWREA